ncbi:hypothetical protein [Nocardia cyriacigeorgica]|uniref:hypothetical protein n=1 Tax=Nocardia cyriacigeorgica TaxID=135487 RepID=UPI0024586ABA|nr:hypothetical protein [Nocardia cyriacigeorgica]
MSRPSGHPGPLGVPPQQYQPGQHQGYPPVPPGGYMVGPQGGLPMNNGGSNRSVEIAVGCVVVFLALMAVAVGLLQFHAVGRLPVSSDPLLREMREDSAGRLRTFGTTLFLLAAMGFVGGYLLLRGKAAVGITLVAMVGFGAFGGGMVGVALSMMAGAPFMAIGSIFVVILGVVTLGLGLSDSTRHLLSRPTPPHPPRR